MSESSKSNAVGVVPNGLKFDVCSGRNVSSRTIDQCVGDARMRPERPRAAKVARTTLKLAGRYSTVR